MRFLATVNRAIATPQAIYPSPELIVSLLVTCAGFGRGAYPSDDGADDGHDKGEDLHATRTAAKGKESEDQGEEGETGS